MITVQVERDRLRPERIRAGTKGSYGLESIKLSFSEEWNGLSCKIVFYPARGKPVEVLYFGEAVAIPREVTMHSGIAKYVVSGYRTTDNCVDLKIISLTGLIDVDATQNDVGGNSIPATPNAYEQLRDDMKSDIADAIQKAVQEGDFKGPPGESATIDAGYTETLQPGENAYVTKAGTSQNAIFNFHIPQGVRGKSGVMLLGDGQTISDVPDDVNVVIIPDGQSIEIADGKNFAILGFVKSADLLNSIENPEQSDAYAVGEEPPYGIYVFDKEKGWVNTGTVNGIQGEPGKDGRGIVSVKKTSGDSTQGSTDVYTILFSDGETTTFDVHNGSDATITVLDSVVSNSEYAVSSSGIAAYVKTELENAIGIILSGES